MASAATVPAEDNVRPATFLWLGALFGLAAGLTEVLYHLAERAFGWRWYLRLSPDFVWMTPVMDLALFAVPALALFGLAHVFRPRRCLPLGLFVLGYLFFANLLLMFGRLHAVPVVLLAVGLSAQTTRFLWRGWPQTRAPLRRGLGWLIVLAVCVTVVQQTGRATQRWREASKQGQAAPGAPNVIIITMDTVRARSMSLYGYRRQTTPRLEQWARQGACFDNALTTAPWTLPSHASMFTGRYPHELSAHWRTPLDQTHPTLAEVLRRKGYRTGGFVANRHYAGADSGLARGFSTYDDYTCAPGEFVNCSALSRWFFNREAVRACLGHYNLYGLKTGAEVNDAFFRWLASADDQPFFAFVNYFDAHDPYCAPPPFDTKFGPPPTAADKTLLINWWKLPHRDLTEAQIDMALRCYDASIAYVDQQVHDLLERLDRRGILKNTLVVITSDHGEHFGEHGRFIHGNSLYRELLHVPLVVLFPGRVPEATRVRECVTLRDLPATVLSLLGEQDANMPGYSLSRFWDPSVPEQPESPAFQLAFAIPPGYALPEQGHSPTATGFIVSLFAQGKYYIRYGAGQREELYDFDGDPRENINLADLPANAALLGDFRRKVNELFRSLPGPHRDLPPPSTSLAGAPPADFKALLARRCCPE